MAQALARESASNPAPEITVVPAPAGTISRPVPEAFRTWLPAIVVLLGLPIVALAVTKFALVPPMKRAASQSQVWSARAAALQSPEPLAFAKIPLGVSGFRSLALVSTDKSFKSVINQNKAKLTLLAISEFKDTTVSDLDKPGALEAKRAQLLADFNSALDQPVIEEIYIAEWPPHRP